MKAGKLGQSEGDGWGEPDFVALLNVQLPFQRVWEWSTLVIETAKKLGLSTGKQGRALAGTGDNT